MVLLSLDSGGLAHPPLLSRVVGMMLDPGDWLPFGRGEGRRINTVCYLGRVTIVGFLFQPHPS